MPQKCSRKKEMIIVDEREPVGELPPPFPPRRVIVNGEEDIREYYDLKREIGRGRFGTVYLVNEKTTGQKFAAKFVNTKRNQDRANVEREIEIMKVLNSERPHPRLIQLYDAFDMRKEMCLVIEIVAGGELFERVIDDDFILTEKACTIFIRQICEGVEFIHSKNILHLDMKPENILCISREGNRVKICDFGLARKYDPRKKLQVLFGTPEFVAPEVVNFEPISFGTDMWSVGVIAYVLLSGLSPFMGHNYVETMTNVTKNKYDFEDEAFLSVSEDAKDFIRKLLVLDKSLRLTPTQCQRHHWLRMPPSNKLNRSCPGRDSESEEESEEEETESDESTDLEDLSFEEKMLREFTQGDKMKKKIEEEKRKEQERIQLEAKRKELERQAEAKRKEIERQQAETKRKELERQEAEAKRKELERQEAEAKRKELERQEEEKRKELARIEAERRKEMEKQEEEAKRKERERQEAEAKRKELEKKQTETKRKELEKQEIARKKELERQEAEAKRKELEKQQAEAKKKELEKQKAEARKKEIEKQKAEEQRKEIEKQQAEAKSKELEKQQAEAKKKELEKQQAEAKRKEELAKGEKELAVTKKQLKEFVERWNSHPNSPYIIGTPIPLDLQRVVKTGGFDSRRGSFTSIMVASPSEPADISDVDDDLDIMDSDEFVHYTIESQKQLSPNQVAKELGEKLSQLQKEEILENNKNEMKNKDHRKKSVPNEMAINESKKIENESQNKNIKEKRLDVDKDDAQKIKDKQPDTINDVNNKKDEKTSKKAPESKRKIVESPKSTMDTKIEATKKAYEERKKMRKNKEEKKRAEDIKTEETKVETDLPGEESKEYKAEKDDSHIRVRSRPSDSQKYVENQMETNSESSNTPEPSTVRVRSRASVAQKNADDVETTNDEEVQTAEEKRGAFEKTRERPKYRAEQNSFETLKRIKERPMSEYKKEYEEYLKLVNSRPPEPEKSPIKDEQKVTCLQKVSTNQKQNENKTSIKKATIDELHKKEDTHKAHERERKTSVGQKKPISPRSRYGKENYLKEVSSRKKAEQMTDDNESRSTKSNEAKNEEHKKLYEEYLKMVGGSEPELERNTNTEINKSLRKFSTVHKTVDIQNKIIGMKEEPLPKEPLKRPEIVALQNEEYVANALPRQRRKSSVGDGLSADHTENTSRGSTPGISGRDDSHSPTPVKQLKKQPSRDVPLQAPLRQRPSRDVPVSYISIAGEEVSGAEKPSDRSSIFSRNTSHEDRSPSREVRDGTPVNHRPSRDVPLTTAQMDKLSGARASTPTNTSQDGQAWPDLIVMPPDADDTDEDISQTEDLSHSLDVPVAALMKSPSGTILSTPSIAVSKDKNNKTFKIDTSKDTDTGYIPSNKLVAWILDIGKPQNQPTPVSSNVTTSTSDRVTQWETRDGNTAKPTRKFSRELSRKSVERSTSTEINENKSTIPNKSSSNLYPLSREPSSVSLKSSPSSDNLFIQTPWGTMRRSPSRSNLYDSTSSDAPSISRKDSQKTMQSTMEDLSQYSQSDDHMSVDSLTRSPSPKIIDNRLQKQDSVDTTEMKALHSHSRLVETLPPKPSEKDRQRSKKEENLNFGKSYSLPRRSKLLKENSTEITNNNDNSNTNETKIDNKKPPIKENESNNPDNLKRKSKFPPPSQKKKLGPLLLFSAQDRISQFEQPASPTSSRLQKPISRTKSNMVFSKTFEKSNVVDNILQNKNCDENKNAKPPPPPYTLRPSSSFGLKRSPTFSSS